MAGVDFKPKRGMIIDIDLNPVKGSETGKIRPCIVVTNDTYNRILSVIQVVPITDWTEKKAAVKTNITLIKSAENGLTKKSIADCLQNRPVDYQKRSVKFRGHLDAVTMKKIDEALRIIFSI
ncbi:MAG: type II toxin-antitoxin system PemK/MazF family toxin [Xenococcaceae cyanobacterium MO_188.B32]|nr:type II toxin-antitoxin system PemK/MazF family toxin [Xenococcaceae cyanobacterium MO_188.B32]